MIKHFKIIYRHFFGEKPKIGECYRYNPFKKNYERNYNIYYIININGNMTHVLSGRIDHRGKYIFDGISSIHYSHFYDDDWEKINIDFSIHQALNLFDKLNVISHR